MTINLGATLIVFIVGLVGVIIAAVKGEYQSSIPWFWTAAWITMLVLLGGFGIR